MSDELHWSDPEFREWEESQLGEFFEREITLYVLDHEEVTYFRQEKGPGVAETTTRNYAGLMFAVKSTEPVFGDRAHTRFFEASEEQLKDALW